MPTAISMTTEEKVEVSCLPTTEAGNPATVDGAVAYVVTSGDCTVEEIDTLSAFIVSGPTAGTSTVEVRADADLGSGVTTLTDSITVTVVSPTAAALGVTASAPVLK